ncbi:hypothetical protein MKEN_00210300 [Mycena kentingensis (nom. inval.)]|nr:hypothetical protein MKEN_00210300 [Mycena kentingensis (nom. inval.)]
MQLLDIPEELVVAILLELPLQDLATLLKLGNRQVCDTISQSAAIQYHVEQRVALVRSHSSAECRWKSGTRISAPGSSARSPFHPLSVSTSSSQRARTTSAARPSMTWSVCPPSALSQVATHRPGLWSPIVPRSNPPSRSRSPCLVHENPLVVVSYTPARGCTRRRSLSSSSATSSSRASLPLLPDIPFAEWGPASSRFLDLASPGQNPCTNLAGQRYVSIDVDDHGTAPVVVYDCTPATVRRASADNPAALDSETARIRIVEDDANAPLPSSSSIHNSTPPPSTRGMCLLADGVCGDHLDGEVRIRRGPYLQYVHYWGQESAGRTTTKIWFRCCIPDRRD